MVSHKEKEARERAKHRRQQDKDTFEKVAAERAAELDAIRKRTEELRNLRLAEVAGRIVEHQSLLEPKPNSPAPSK